MTGISGRLGAFYCCWSCCCCRSSVVLLCFYQCTLFNFSVCLCCRFTGHSFSLFLTHTHTLLVHCEHTKFANIRGDLCRSCDSLFFLFSPSVFIPESWLFVAKNGPPNKSFIPRFSSWCADSKSHSHTLTLAHPIHSHVGIHSFNRLTMQKPKGKEGDRMEKSHITTKYRYGVDLNWIQVPILTASLCSIRLYFSIHKSTQWRQREQVPPTTAIEHKSMGRKKEWPEKAEKYPPSSS